MSENAPQATAVLRHHFPGVRISRDVRSIRQLPNCDILTAGWPCQDLSQAGGTSGIAGDQSGLIRHVFDLLRQKKSKPQFIILENVAFALHLQEGRAISYVTRQLELLGYSWAYRILDSAYFGVPQRRRRIYILASLDFDPSAILMEFPAPLVPSAASNNAYGFYWTEGNRGLGWTPDGFPPLKGGSGFSIPSPPALWQVNRASFETPGVADAERLQGFPENWTQPASLVDGDRCRWKLVGNAISVPVAKWLFQRIAEMSPGDLGALGVRECRPKERHNAAFCLRGSKLVTLVGEEGPAKPISSRISEFGLGAPKPLSLRAARGFLGRYRKSSLRKHNLFLDHLDAYCAA